MNWRGFALGLTTALVAFNTSAKPAAGTGPLWIDHSTLGLELKADFTDLFQKQGQLPAVEGKQSDDGPEAYVKGSLSYKGDNGKVTVPVMVRVRGASTKTACPFPKLDVEFADPKAAKGTLFEGNAKFKIGTHCADNSNTDGLTFQNANQLAPHREALIYRIQDILGLPALKSRPAVIKYIYQDPDAQGEPAKTITRSAFLLETPGSFEKRTGLKQIYVKDSPQYKLALAEAQKKNETLPGTFVDAVSSKDINQVLLLIAFENMTGNYDWYLPFKSGAHFGAWNLNETTLWNMKAYIGEDGGQIVQGIDFNLATLAMQTQGYTPAFGNLEEVAKSSPEYMAAARNALNTILSKKAEILKAADDANFNCPDPNNPDQTIHDQVGDEGMHKGLKELFEKLPSELQMLN